MYTWLTHFGLCGVQIYKAGENPQFEAGMMNAYLISSLGCLMENLVAVR